MRLRDCSPDHCSLSVIQQLSPRKTAPLNCKRHPFFCAHMHACVRVCGLSCACLLLIGSTTVDAAQPRPVVPTAKPKLTVIIRICAARCQTIWRARTDRWRCTATWRRTDMLLNGATSGSRRPCSCVVVGSPGVACRRWARSRHGQCQRQRRPGLRPNFYSSTPPPPSTPNPS